MTPKKVWSFIQRKTLEYIVKLNNKNFTDIGNIFGAWTEREYFNSSIYLETVKSSFEDLKLPIPKQYDFYLSQMYGDYMQLPPLEKRVPRHREL